MPGLLPKTIWLYRMLHCDNLSYVLQKGMCARTFSGADPNYINIGDSELIAKRADFPIGINPPGGYLGEFVPFYFGGHSPMLLNLKTGYRGIKQRQQSEIVFVICKLEVLVSNCKEWCFTDGHAKNKFTTFYNDLSYLEEVDWTMVDEQYWSNTDDDFDRMRWKQAEFLVKNTVPPFCIGGIVVYSDTIKLIAEQAIVKVGLGTKVYVDTQKKLYY